ncbi:hypothetical protein ACT3R5_15955 [Glutamicibacter sp. AOP5-A2-7]
MTSYIGPVGSLIPVKCPSSLSVSGGRGVSFTRTLGRQKAFMGRVTSRTWEATLSAATEPRKMAGLAWLVDYGTPPFVWYGSDAAVGNILEPSVAGLVPTSISGLEGPMVEVEAGVWVKSALPTVTSVSMPYRGGSLDPVAVVPGVALTVSGWVRGASSVAVVWRDVLGASMSTVTASFGTSTGLVRRWATFTPPSGAVQMTLQFFCTQLAGPAVSLTDAVAPYVPGKGCKRAVPHGLSEALTMTTRESSMGGYSFTITEVG